MLHVPKTKDKENCSKTLLKTWQFPKQKGKKNHKMYLKMQKNSAKVQQNIEPTNFFLLKIAFFKWKLRIC